MEKYLFEAVYETVLQRDTRFDGQYYIGVLTTRIVCRPSCRSRTPKPENIRIFTSVEEAFQKGFRSCKRCRPDQPGKDAPDAALVNSVINLIDISYKQNWTLNSIATHFNISPYHLQRVFKRIEGTTPSKHLLHKRLEVAKTLLSENEQPIFEIAKEVGFLNSSHFCSVFQKVIGKTPSEYRYQTNMQ